MAFFPSYKMMEEVYEAFLDLLALKENEVSQEGITIESSCQQSGMKEEEREVFLEEFSEEKSHERQGSFVAFCVMGGILGEGIDLKKEQLIGAIIVGTGLPQISNEREILMNYYEKCSGEGFDYAYRYPGMNKVLQAAGRVIRTEQDRGVILLMDDRFQYGEYKSLFPMEWDDCQTITLSDAERRIGAFWKQTEQKEQKNKKIREKDS